MATTAEKRTPMAEMTSKETKMPLVLPSEEKCSCVAFIKPYLAIELLPSFFSIDLFDEQTDLISVIPTLELCACVFLDLDIREGDCAT